MGLGSWIKSRIDWLRAADLRLLAELAAVAILVLVFIVIGSEIGELDTDAFDRSILLALRAAPDDPIGSHNVEAAVVHLSALGSGTVTTLVVIIATAFLALAGRWRYALLVIACAVGTLILMEVLKSFYDRPRPTVVTQLDPPGGLSFPSGHSMISAALYLTLGVLIARALPRRRLRVFAVATGAFLAIVIGVSRLYLGVHYPTDVLGGWTAGLTWALILGVIVRRLGQRHVAGVPEPQD
jgi:undecaprenyl-diphosphatase